MSNLNIPASNLQLTRKQLDDLDALVQKMLELPEARVSANKVEKNAEDLASMGIFAPGEAPWPPKKPSQSDQIPLIVLNNKTPVEETKELPSPIQNTQKSILEPANLTLVKESGNENTSSKEPLSEWKPSNLTWAPFAQSWEKLKQQELEKASSLVATSLNPLELQQIAKVEIKTLDDKTFVNLSDLKTHDNQGFKSELNHSNAPPNATLWARKKDSKLKRLVLDALGFVGILLFVCAAALYLSTALDWPMR